MAQDLMGRTCDGMLKSLPAAQRAAVVRLCQRNEEAAF